MTFVATLISNPAAPALDAAAIERARAALPSPQAPNWLDPGIAADIPFIATLTNSQVTDSRPVADRVPPSMSWCSRRVAAARRCFWPTWIRP
jgi:phosphoserine phosphatase